MLFPLAKILYNENIWINWAGNGESQGVARNTGDWFKPVKTV